MDGQMDSCGNVHHCASLECYTDTMNYHQTKLPGFGCYWSMASPALSTMVSSTKQLKDEYNLGVEYTVSTPFYSPPYEHSMGQKEPYSSSMVSLKYPHAKLQYQILPNPHQSTDRIPMQHGPDLSLPGEQLQPKSFSLDLASDWRCEQCNRHFASQTGLKHHNNARHGVLRPHRCEKCGKRFSEQALLYRHILRHSTHYKPYKCDQCPKTFCYRTDLRRHEYVHTGNKPYVCSICARAFVRRDHMQRHELTHKRQDSPTKELRMKDCMQN